MSVFDDIKAKADQNGDGKLSAADLDELKGQLPTDKLEQLKQLADQNDDGKISLDDVKSIDFGDMMNNAKNSLGGLFK